MIEFGHDRLALSVPSAPSPTHGAASRRLALPLSVVLHAAVLYALMQVPWSTMQDVRPAPEFVWLSGPRLAPQLDEPAPETRAAEPASAATPRARTPETRPLPTTEPSTRPAPVTAPPITEAPAKTPPSREEPRRRETPSPPQSAPQIDWAKERQRAAAGVIAQRAREGRARHFSADDLVPPAAPPQDPPLVVVPKDHCVIVTGKLERFAMQMFGRCVRDADGDLFAAIKPEYLKSHPVCEAVAGAPATFVDARGNEYSTTKCRLVLEAE